MNVNINEEELSRILNCNTELYRYDLDDNLPDDWTTDYHSKEYTCDRGFKNKCGAFFFFDNKQTALDVFKYAAEKGAREGTITTCYIKKQVSLLDLSDFQFPSGILCFLNKNGMSVFNKGFYRYGENQSEDVLFDDIKALIDEILSRENDTLEDMSFIINKSNQINEFFYFKECSPCKCRYIGQLLTDFDNGPKFKEILLDKGYDGYCFKEIPKGVTYCIFDHNVLSAPRHEKIII